MSTLQMFLPFLDGNQSLVALPHFDTYYDRILVEFLAKSFGSSVITSFVKKTLGNGRNGYGKAMTTLSWLYSVFNTPRNKGIAVTSNGITESPK